MKKIIIGSMLTILCPFLVILGYNVFTFFNISVGAQMLVSVFSVISITFNFIIGIFLIVKGYQENETFKGW